MVVIFESRNANTAHIAHYRIQAYPQNSTSSVNFMQRTVIQLGRPKLLCNANSVLTLVPKPGYPTTIFMIFVNFHPSLDAMLAPNVRLSGHTVRNTLKGRLYTVGGQWHMVNRTRYGILVPRVDDNLLLGPSMHGDQIEIIQDINLCLFKYRGPS